MFACVVNSGMSLAIEQAVTQLEQEVFTLKTQVASQTRLPDAVRAINNLAKAQVRKDTPSLIDVNGLGRPKEVTGKEEDFQQCSEKTEAFFCRGVIKEPEMMLEWSAENVTEITQELTDQDALPTSTNVERGVRNLEFVLQQMHTSLTALTSYEPNDFVANSRKNSVEAWRSLQKRNDLPTGGRERNLLRTIVSLGECSSFWNFKRGSNDGNPACRASIKKYKEKLDDEIKLACLRALVPELNVDTLGT